MSFRWYAREKKNWKKPPYYTDLEGTIINYKGYFYTPFTARQKTLEKALSWHLKNGKFFEDRKVTLQLFCGEEPVSQTSRVTPAER